MQTDFQPVPGHGFGAPVIAKYHCLILSLIHGDSILQRIWISDGSPKAVLNFDFYYSSFHPGPIRVVCSLNMTFSLTAT